MATRLYLNMSQNATEQKVMFNCCRLSMAFATVGTHWCCRHQIKFASLKVSQTVIHGDRGRDAGMIISSLVPNSIFRRSSLWFKSGSDSGFESKIDRRIGGRRLRHAHYKKDNKQVGFEGLFSRGSNDLYTDYNGFPGPFPE